MNESSRGLGGEVGDPPISGGFPPNHTRDPPISGGFDSPPNPKEDYPTPPLSSQGQTTDLPSLGAFGQEDLGK